MKNRAGFTSEQKKRMTLSNETLLGIRRTGRVDQSIILSFISCIMVKSFIELVQYLFTLPEVKDNQLAFLSNKLCQDPLENFSGVSIKGVAHMTIQQLMIFIITHKHYVS